MDSGLRAAFTQLLFDGRADEPLTFLFEKAHGGPWPSWCLAQARRCLRIGAALRVPVGRARRLHKPEPGHGKRSGRRQASVFSKSPQDGRGFEFQRTMHKTVVSRRQNRKLRMFFRARAYLARRRAL